MSAISSGSGQDFDLNIAPIIDCFTVLITYLLVSASFLSLSVFDVGVAATGEMAPPAANQKPTDPPLSLSILMKQQGTFDLKLTGGFQNLDLSISLANEEALVAKLSEFARQMPLLKEANISAEPTVRYREMIKVIEDMKKTLPKVFIAGT